MYVNATCLWITQCIFYSHSFGHLSYESTGSSEKISTQKRKKDALLLHSTDSKVDVFLLAAFPAATAVGEEQRGFLLHYTLVEINGAGFDSFVVTP